MISLPLGAARAELLGAAVPLAAIEHISVENALGRVTAEALRAGNSVPHYLGAAMDGIAVRAADTAAAAEGHPIELEEGDPAAVERAFSYVDTGQELPAWADAVIMIEKVFAAAVGVSPTGPRRRAAADRPARVHVLAPAAPWQHVRLVGEDVVASEIIAPRGHRLRPVDIGALLAAGVLEVPVRPRPVVALLPTGDELIEPGEDLRPGRIVEFNSRMIAAFVREWGGEPLRLPPSRDERSSLVTRLEEARERADVVCIIAGSSVGRHDFTVDALAAAGRILARGIDVVPGRPTILAAFDSARSGRARVALGIPGYPVSALVACRELLEPLLAHLLGTAPLPRESVRATLLRDLASRSGNEELIRVNLGCVSGRMVAAPLGRGAGALTTVVRADGLIRVPPATSTIQAGAEIEVELLRTAEEARHTIFVHGSREPVLAVLEDELRKAEPLLRLATCGGGGTSAAAALARGEAHLALSAYPREAESFASDGIVRVFHLGTRSRGLIVPRGNPRGLRCVEDLEGLRVCTVERSPCTADRRSADPLDRIACARRDAPSEVAVAAAVQSGLADAGVGSEAAARSLGLDFWTLESEELRILLRADFASSPAGEVLLQTLRSDALRSALAQLGGCDASRSGEELFASGRGRAEP